MNDAERSGPATALYWIYDADGMLIYVGISNDPDQRFKEHGQNSTWWPLAARRNVEWFETREDAAATEAWAIKRYDPYFNRTYALKPEGNPAYDAGIKELCRKLSISRPVLVTALLDRELAARGLLGSEPCFQSFIGWPDGIAVDESDGACGTYVGTSGGKR